MEAPAIPERGGARSPIAQLRASPRLALAVLLAASWLVLSGWVLRFGDPASGAWRPGTTDHSSHWSTAILFRHRGFDVYRRPIAEICPLVEGSGCNIPERAGKRLLYPNWREYPRPYPPGWALWHAPAAVAWETTSISYSMLNRLVIVQDLVGAHLALYALAVALLLPRPGPSEREDGAAVTVRLFVVVLVGQELLRWAMLGFYDPIAVFFAVLAVIRLAERRDVDAVVWLSCAVFLHFRALWLAPVLVFAIVRAAREGALFARPALARTSCAAALLASSGAAFVLVQPSLASFPQTNPLFRLAFDPKNEAHWDFVVPVVVASAVLLHARALLVASVVAFQTFVVLRAPQSQSWHALGLAPVFALARVAPGRHRGTEVAVAALFLVEARQIFRLAPLPGGWLAALFGG